MDSPAIVIPTFNRTTSLQRLLSSLTRAKFPADNIPLVISIDGGGDSMIANIAEEFKWQHGEKVILKSDYNLGYKSHILLLGDLTSKYGSIILLEDDTIVAANFYEFAIRATNFYMQDHRICGIALYSFRINEASPDCAPFIPIQNGFDAFFMQVPCSWGQVWTYEQWKPFRQFIESSPTISVSDKIPDEVKMWPETSLKKYMYKYLVENDLYYVYPYDSFTTNFGDAGNHVKFGNTGWQSIVSLTDKSDFEFPRFSFEHMVYDSFMELNPESFRSLGANIPANSCIDLYGQKNPENFHEEFWITSKESSSPIAQYGLQMLPWENNIIFSIVGSFFKLTSRNHVIKSDDKPFSEYARLYSDFSYRAGEQTVRGSLSYKIGKLILSPFHFIKKAL